MTETPEVREDLSSSRLVDIAALADRHDSSPVPPSAADEGHAPPSPPAVAAGDAAASPAAGSGAEHDASAVGMGYAEADGQAAAHPAGGAAAQGAGGAGPATARAEVTAGAGVAGGGSDAAASGSVAPGSAAPGSAAPGSVAPGSVAPGSAASDGTAAELADPDRLRAAVEAVLLVVDAPTTSMMLAQVLGRSVTEVEAALRALQAEYDSGGRGLDLREVAEGWRLYSRDDFAAYVERFVLDGQQARLTQAALETLSVIAYRQPVTRSRISGIRGVSVDAVMRTLLTRGLVEECGADPDTGGGLYRTTRLFLEKMGLRSLDELPSLAPLLPDTSQMDDVALST